MAIDTSPSCAFIGFWPTGVRGVPFIRTLYDARLSYSMSENDSDIAASAFADRAGEGRNRAETMIIV